MNINTAGQIEPYQRPGIGQRLGRTMRNNPLLTAAVLAGPVGLSAYGAYQGADALRRWVAPTEEEQRQRELNQDYDFRQQYDESYLTPQERAELAERQRREAARFDQDLMQRQQMVNRRIGRDVLRQETDANLALQGQTLRSQDAQSLLNNMTQQVLGNQQFLQSLNEGLRYA